MMFWPLLALLALRSRSTEQPLEVDLWAGHHYRFSGDLRSRSVVDTVDVKRKLEFSGFRDVVVGERPPHRIQATFTPLRSFRLRIGQLIPTGAEGLSFVVTSIHEIKGPEAVVGRRRGR